MVKVKHREPSGTDGVPCVGSGRAGAACLARPPAPERRDYAVALGFPTDPVTAGFSCQASWTGLRETAQVFQKPANER